MDLQAECRLPSASKVDWGCLLWGGLLTEVVWDAIEEIQCSKDSQPGGCSCKPDVQSGETLSCCFGGFFSFFFFSVLTQILHEKSEFQARSPTSFAGPREEWKWGFFSKISKHFNGVTVEGWPSMRLSWPQLSHSSSLGMKPKGGQTSVSLLNEAVWGNSPGSAILLEVAPLSLCQASQGHCEVSVTKPTRQSS